MTWNWRRWPWTRDPGPLLAEGSKAALALELYDEKLARKRLHGSRIVFTAALSNEATHVQIGELGTIVHVFDSFGYPSEALVVPDAVFETGQLHTPALRCELKYLRRAPDGA